MMRIWCVLSSLLVTSCAIVQPPDRIAPGGSNIYSMRCSQTGYTLNDCYRKAGALCSNHYTIVDKISGTVGVPVRGGIMTVPHYNIAVQCS
jgi:hypothetical protein